MKLKELELKYPGISQLIKNVKKSPLGKKSNILKFTHSKFSLKIEIQTDFFNGDNLEWAPISLRAFNYGEPKSIKIYSKSDFSWGSVGDIIFEDLNIEKEPEFIELENKYKDIMNEIQDIELKYKIEINHEFDPTNNSHRFDIYESNGNLSMYEIKIKGNVVEIINNNDIILKNKKDRLNKLKAELKSLEYELYGNCDEDEGYEDWLEEDVYDDLDDDWGDK
jgi:hypothetical protein